MTEIRTVVYKLFGLALLCCGMAAVYANHHAFEGPLGQTVPDISPTGVQLALAFQVTAALCVLWGALLGWVGTPGGAARARRAWGRAVRAEERRPVAVGAASLLAVAYTVVRLLANEETYHAPLDALTAGEARLPFQYRALVPWMVRALTEAVPVYGSLTSFVQYAPFEVVAALGAYGGVLFLMRTLGMGTAESRIAALVVFPLLAFNLAAPWRYNAIYFPYDTPSVAFFAVGLGLLVRRKMALFYVVFVLATLNRETTCFLAFAYLALALGRERPSRIAFHVAVQTAIWVGVKAALAVLYAGNEPFDPSALGLFGNMVDRSVRITLSVPGLVYIVFVTMGGLGGVLVLARGWVKDDRIRRLFWIVVPFGVGMFVVGEMMEVRIYSELIPLVAVGLAEVAHAVTTEVQGRTVAGDAGGAGGRGASRPLASRVRKSMTDA